MEFRDKIYYQCNTPRDNLLSLKCARLSHQVSRVPSSTRKPEMSGLDILYTVQTVMDYLYLSCLWRANLSHLTHHCPGVTLLDDIQHK